MMNCGDHLRRVLIPIFSLVKPHNGYSECLIQAHGLLIYVPN